MTTLDERAQAASLRASSERLRPADGLDRLLGRRRRTVRLAVVGAFALLAALLLVVVQLRPHEEVVEPARPVSSRPSWPGTGSVTTWAPAQVAADRSGCWPTTAASGSWWPAWLNQAR